VIGDALDEAGKRRAAGLLKAGLCACDDVLALIMAAAAGEYIQERETTTIEIALVGDAILGRQPLPDALTWHCASSLPPSRLAKPGSASR
jgi:hypothetical protein